VPFFTRWAFERVDMGHLGCAPGDLIKKAPDRSLLSVGVPPAPQYTRLSLWRGRLADFTQSS
jgi:hypothetical protein